MRGSTRKLRLSGGGYTLVDPDDYDRLRQHRWRLNEGGYVFTIMGGRKVRLHRLLLDAPTDQLVDHRNGRPTDNRRENLRLCSASGNARNTARRRSGRAPYKGVRHSPCGRYFVARIRVNGRLLHIGSYDTARDAALAYDAAALFHFGDFARCNIPRGSHDPPVPRRRRRPGAAR